MTTTEATIKTHVSNILSKLHLANRVQAALYALHEGVTVPEDTPENEAQSSPVHKGSSLPASKPYGPRKS